MKPRINLSLRLVFLLTITALTALLAVLLYVVIDGSRRSIIESSSRLRDEAGQRISGEVVDYLASAEKTLDDVEGQCKYGSLSVDDPAALEAALFSAVRSTPRLAEVTLTHAAGLAYADNGRLDHATGDRWQVSLFRVLGDADPTASTDRVVTRRVVAAADGPTTQPTTGPATGPATQPDGPPRFAAEYRDRPPGGGLSDGV